MRIVATSDFHGFLPEIPECDLLLIGGDICPVENHDRKFQADWLRGEFRDWLAEQPALVKIWTGGNHDFVLQDWRNKPEKIQGIGGKYLDNTWLEIPGVAAPFDRPLKIWASPMSPTFGNWAFMRDDRGLGEIWETIPRDIDILMVHGPMHGYGDGVPEYVLRPRLGSGIGSKEDAWDSWHKEYLGDEHVGSVSLLNRLAYEEFPNLKLFVFGHIHEGYGQQVVTLKNNKFIAANVSHVNGDYKPLNPPMEFKL